jgi:hypothetical protein
MKLKLSLVAAALTLTLSALAAFVAPAAHAASPATGAISAPINGTTAGGVPVVGQFNVTSFRVVDGALTAVGTFTGTVDGVQTSTPATAAVTATGSCRILDLTLSPLHLDLLGLVVDLNQVHLTITAQSGPGNLLGNLLCAVANLLNGSGSGTALTQIANLLNQILARL